MGLLLPTFALIGLVLAMYAAAKFMRDRLGVGAGTVAPDAMKIVGKRMVDRGKALYVVEVGERYIIVGASESSLSLIDHVTAEEFAAMSEPVERTVTALRTAAKPAARRARSPRPGGRLLAPGQGLARMLGIRTPADIESAREAGAPTGSGANGFMTIGESFSYFMGKARRQKSDATTADDGAIELSAESTTDTTSTAEAG